MAEVDAPARRNARTGQRLPGLADDAMSETARAALGGWWPPFNIHRVLAHNPETLQSWIGFGTHILRENALGERLRELVVLRIAWNACCAYEWGQHAGLSARIGIPEADIARVPEGPDAPGWTPLERALLSGVDELMTTSHVSDPVYAVLADHLSPRQLIDYVFLIGEFVLVAFTLNLFRVEPDPGLRPLPEGA
jgi:4-carboxymuconolactone decarboxylase